MRLSDLSIFLLLGHLFVVNAVSSTSFHHLEPVLGAKLSFKEESSEVRRRRAEDHQPFPSELSLSFEAFGTIFDFDLEVFRQITEGTKITFSGGEHDPVEERPLQHKVYRGSRKNELGEEVGWINLVAHEDGLFHALINHEGNIFVVDPLRVHERELEHSAKRDLEALSDLVIYKTEDMKVGDKLCGAVTLKSRAVKNETARGDEFGSETVLHPQGRIGRGLKTVARWTSCFPNDSVTRRFSIAFYADQGYYAVIGSTQARAEESILGIISNSNIVYYTQVNVFLYAGTITVKTAASSEAFNQVNGACTTIENTLTNFKNWRATQKNDDDGTYHLLTDCYPPPGTVGLAYVGVLCYKNSGAGVSTYSSSTWLTVAHEVGHNFGANHAFQEGQGTTGGIMDYGDGKLNGEYQFHTTYNKAEVCAEITSSMSLTGTSAVANCWKNFAATCGNGIVEPGEACDDTSSCCVGCKLAPGSFCSGGPCCKSCQYVASTTMCGLDSGGYCDRGACKPSSCSNYGIKFCGVTSSNPCLQACILDGSTQCIPATSLSPFPDPYLPDGSLCKLSPYSTCVSGVCTATTAPTPVPSNSPTDSPSNSPTDSPSNSPTDSPSNSPSNSPTNAPVYTWVLSDDTWSPCSATCGENGTQFLDYVCKDSNGKEVSTKLCTDPMPAPTSNRPCEGVCKEKGKAIGIAVGVVAVVVLAALGAVGFFVLVKRRGRSLNRKGLATESTSNLHNPLYSLPGSTKSFPEAPAASPPPSPSLKPAGLPPKPAGPPPGHSSTLPPKPAGPPPGQSSTLPPKPAGPPPNQGDTLPPRPAGPPPNQGGTLPPRPAGPPPNQKNATLPPRPAGPPPGAAPAASPPPSPKPAGSPSLIPKPAAGPPPGLASKPPPPIGGPKPAIPKPGYNPN